MTESDECVLPRGLPRGYEYRAAEAADSSSSAAGEEPVPSGAAAPAERAQNGQSLPFHLPEQPISLRSTDDSSSCRGTFSPSLRSISFIPPQRHRGNSSGRKGSSRRARRDPGGDERERASHVEPRRRLRQVENRHLSLPALKTRNRGGKGGEGRRRVSVCQRGRGGRDSSQHLYADPSITCAP